MATPKHDLINVELSRRINDAVVEAATNGNILSSSDRVAYVNKAMMKYINDAWLQVGGNVNAFIQIFPELVAIRTVALTSPSATYTIANPNLDFFTLVSGLTATGKKYVAAAPKDRLQIFQSGSLPTYAPTADYPQMVEIGGVVYVFPTTITENINLAFIKLPLNPTTGAFLTQGGSYDSPFYDLHNSKIAEIAEQLYRIDAQEST